jgi:hypothetical protein
MDINPLSAGLYHRNLFPNKETNPRANLNASSVALHLLVFETVQVQRERGGVIYAPIHARSFEQMFGNPWRALIRLNHSTLLLTRPTLELPSQIIILGVIRRPTFCLGPEGALAALYFAPPPMPTLC